MDRETLQKVQSELLDIALEVRRVCRENDIPFFLSAGSMLGAVRHGGFIPWDDDLDVGMLREDYEKFCRIAPEKLGKDYCFQTWHTDPNYALPFGKVRKRGTLYLEGKHSQLQENGFYVDVFPFDNLPEEPAQREKLRRTLLRLYRVKLMKSHDMPWMENGRILWKKRIGYLYYQVLALFTDQKALIRKFEDTVLRYPMGQRVYEQYPESRVYDHSAKTMQELGQYSFEGHTFPGPKDADQYLRDLYGDYMTPPPEDQRENRHQIREIRFSK